MRSDLQVRTVLATLGLAALCAVLSGMAAAGAAPKAPPPRYTFAGIPWLVAGDSARDRLVERGYLALAAASDSQHLVLRGRLYEHDALVTGHLDERGRVVRWVVLIAPRGDPFPFPGMRALFDQVVRDSEGRYGRARRAVERYRFPYEKGDGREDKALRDGLATIRWDWASKSGDRLAVEMDANVSVVLTYECSEWSALEGRRRAKRASDL